ncbi:MAG TPA: dTDP-glucose 4,6-dehydratase [Burkholderiaceae bacterium]|nr:dTDP-glucose 4,6-dehydratase [Burkholderiaceae bacterium]
MILVTGGAGFVGSNFVHQWLAHTDEPVVNVDKLTYAGSLDNLPGSLQAGARHTFVRADIVDRALLDALLAKYRPRAIVHLAAESHVDHSISDPSDFVQTNVVGTYQLLEAVRAYWTPLASEAKRDFRFIHVSTDEVFGSLGALDPPFTEASAYAPNNPYAASKAAADHWVRAWHQTYGLPTVVLHTTNNYGPFQLPEKLMPLCIARALAGQPLPIYGDGQQVRDWIHVNDHCSAIRCVLNHGRAGRSYNVGSRNELSNLELVHRLCALLDGLRPRADGGAYAEQIRFVADRPGHDRRYGVDPSALERDLAWRPAVSFADGLRETVQWYLDHPQWVASAIARRK